MRCSRRGRSASPCRSWPRDMDVEGGLFRGDPNAAARRRDRRRVCGQCRSLPAPHGAPVSWRRRRRPRPRRGGRLTRDAVAAVAVSTSGLLSDVADSFPALVVLASARQRRPVRIRSGEGNAERLQYRGPPRLPAIDAVLGHSELAGFANRCRGTFVAAIVPGVTLARGPTSPCTAPAGVPRVSGRHDKIRFPGWPVAGYGPPHA